MKQADAQSAPITTGEVAAAVEPFQDEEVAVILAIALYLLPMILIILIVLAGRIWFTEGGFLLKVLASVLLPV